MPLSSGCLRAGRLAGALVVALLGGVSPAAADPVSTEQAQALESTLTAWLRDAIGPAVTLPPRPVEVTASGDHYRLAIPFALLLAGAGTQAAGAGALTAVLTPGSAGTWAIDDVIVPSAGHYAFDAGRDGRKRPVELDVTLTGQNTHALFDPDFTAPSTLTSTLGTFDLRISAVDQQQTQHADDIAAHAALTPTAAGRADITEDVSARNLTARTHTSDDHTVAIGARHLSLAAHLDEIDPPKLLAAMQAIGRIGGSLAPDRRLRPSTALDHAAVRDMILTLRDIASGGEINEVLDDVTFAFDGHDAGAARLRIGIGAAAPAGMLAAHLEFGLDGLSIAELPPAMAAYLPDHVILRPFVSGLSMADATRMALAANDGQQTPDTAALWSHGGITFGFETLALDIGPAHFAGTARMLAKSAGAVTGKAQVTAVHLDALLRLVEKDPLLSSAVPVVLMLRGLGRGEGDTTVWDVVVDDASIIVNGTDLTALLGRK